MSNKSAECAHPNKRELSKSRRGLVTTLVMYCEDCKKEIGAPWSVVRSGKIG